MKLATVMAAVGSLCLVSATVIVFGDIACDGGAGYCEQQADPNPCPANTCYASAITCPDGTGTSHACGSVKIPPNDPCPNP
jgi:hypothetical protein